MNALDYIYKVGDILKLDNVTLKAELAGTDNSVCFVCDNEKWQECYFLNS